MAPDDFNTSFLVSTYLIYLPLQLFCASSVCQVLAYMLSSLTKCQVLHCLHGCSFNLVFNQLSYLHEMLDNGAFLHVFSIQFFLTCEVKSVCTCTFVFGCEIQS
jgi:hypothetical protein